MTKNYIGTKEIVAWPQGKDVPHSERNPLGYEHGYAVKYPDGYTSWSPKAAFEAAYRATEGEDQALSFGDVLHILKTKSGARVARKGWLSKGAFVALAAGAVESALELHQGERVATWVPSQEAMLADDWIFLGVVADEGRKDWPEEAPEAPAFDPSIPRSGSLTRDVDEISIPELMAAAAREAKAAIPVEYRNRITFSTARNELELKVTVFWKYKPA